MNKYDGKKLLVLGGKPIGSCEIVEFAKSHGAYVIVADYLPKEKSPAKKIANEEWDVSTGDVEALIKLIAENNVDGVIAGVHEFNIERAIELCQQIGLPYYCTRDQWHAVDNKYIFKELCSRFEIPTAKTYNFNDDIEYPVVVKPTDSSGSRGIAICEDKSCLANAIRNALAVSEEKKYLIEEFVDSDACIVHYTVVNGDVFYSGMSDKVSMSFTGGSRVMALQTFPSKSEQFYLKTLNDKVISMIKFLGIRNGPIWIEVFNDVKKCRMLFNEAGFRFGGSMTNHVVKYYYSIDQLDNIVSCSLGVATSTAKLNIDSNRKKYCILPVHIKPGVIKRICGDDYVKKMANVNAIAYVHFEGDEIKPWGTAQQVFCYLHVLYDTSQELCITVEEILKVLNVQDMHDNNMLFTLFDIAKLEEI